MAVESPRDGKLNFLGETWGVRNLLSYCVCVLMMMMMMMMMMMKIIIIIIIILIIIIVNISILNTIIMLCV